MDNSITKNMSRILNNAIYWVDVDKVHPNPFQPRREFDEVKLKSLADSIQQYGILQPLVVTRLEEEKEDGGLTVSYELIAGERRLRASKIAGTSQVPVIIREMEANDDQLKLELAIIENIQREELNPIDRARAFKQLIDKFGFKHAQVAVKVGKSREYVSNSIRLLSLPDEIIAVIIEGRITEGHARPLLMLSDQRDEQAVLFKEILIKKLTVREAERIARHTAQDKVRKRSHHLDPELIALEQRLTIGLGTRVQIEKRERGGKITIDFISASDLSNILDRLESDVDKDNLPFSEDVELQERKEEAPPQGEEHSKSESQDTSSIYSQPPATPVDDVTEQVTEQVIEQKEADTTSEQRGDGESVVGWTREVTKEVVTDTPYVPEVEIEKDSYGEVSEELKHSEIKSVEEEDDDDLYQLKNFSL